MKCAHIPPNDSQLNQEWRSLPQHPSPRCGGARKYFLSALQNPGKNRYPDVLPYEHTRVQLPSSGRCQSDYINANYIYSNPEHDSPTFVACQAPLPHTFTDFFEMIWASNTSVVVMLTRLLERNRVKAHCYWPSSEGEREVFGDISVTLIKATHKGDKLCYRLFKLQHQGQERDILHIHYSEWPDFGVPQTTSLIREVVATAETYRSVFQEKYGLTEKPLITVHCSAGIGRAGTFIAIAIWREHALKGEDVSIKETVELLREQRMGMVQTKEQYKFIYHVINEMDVKETCSDNLNTYILPSSSNPLHLSMPNLSSVSCPRTLHHSSPSGNFHERKIRSVSNASVSILTFNSPNANQPIYFNVNEPVTSAVSTPVIG